MPYDTNPIDLDHPRLVADIVKDLNQRLSPTLCSIGEGGFHAVDWPSQSVSVMPCQWYRMACFAVRGSSEGYYVHIELIDKNTTSRSLLALAKVWSWQDAFQLSNAATLILHGEPCTAA